jgi:elongation factor G
MLDCLYSGVFTWLGRIRRLLLHVVRLLSALHPSNSIKAMKTFETKDIKNIVLVGSTKAGKTMLAETMMYEGGVLTRRGSIEEANTASDYTELEKEKGYSIYASLLHTIWRDTKINIIDTPGNDNFVGELLAGLRAADTVVMVLNAQHGIEIGTEVIWRHVKASGKPMILVANQIDGEKADFEKLLEEARQLFGPAVVPMQFPYNPGPGFDSIVDLLKMTHYKFKHDGGKPDKLQIPGDVADKATEWHNTLVEAAAENDESLMERYFAQGSLDEDEMAQGLRLGIMKGSLYPLFVVSAVQNMGSGRMMGFIGNVCPTAADAPVIHATDGTEVACDSNGSNNLFIWKNTTEQHLGEVTFFKVQSGVLHAGDDLQNARTGHLERFGHLFVGEGKKKHPVERLYAGDLGLTVKLKDGRTNDSYHPKGAALSLEPIHLPAPRLETAVHALNKNDEEKMGEALHALAHNDPTLIAGFRGDIKQTILQGQGDMHLNVVKAILEKQYKIPLEFVKPRISYRETISGIAIASYRHKKQSGGAGQFAEVHLQIDPYVEGKEAPTEHKVRETHLIDLEGGGKFEFLNCIVGGVIDARFVPSVMKGILDHMNEGPLTGSPVRDVRVCLFDGRMHPVDSNEMAFKIAASHAFQEGFLNARPNLLEPMMELEVITPEEVLGEVMTDLQNRRGIILGIDAVDGWTTLKAKVPLAELYKYANTLRSLTQGRASHASTFSEYALVTETLKNQIVKAIKTPIGIES